MEKEYKESETTFKNKKIKMNEDIASTKKQINQWKTKFTTCKREQGDLEKSLKSLEKRKKKLEKDEEKAADKEIDSIKKEIETYETCQTESKERITYYTTYITTIRTSYTTYKKTYTKIRAKSTNTL